MPLVLHAVLLPFPALAAEGLQSMKETDPELWLSWWSRTKLPWHGCDALSDKAFHWINLSAWLVIVDAHKRIILRQIIAFFFPFIFCAWQVSPSAFSCFLGPFLKCAQHRWDLQRICCQTWSFLNICMLRVFGGLYPDQMCLVAFSQEQQITYLITRKLLLLSCKSVLK